jgi:DNA-binding transcriptional LysR family regulator
VSHQIRALEDWLGAAVFSRSVRVVVLTPVGAALAVDCTGAFDRLADAAARARASAHDTRLRISALPLFTAVWLTPRLAKFQAKHPDLALEIDTSNRLADFARDDVDVAIRNLFAPTPGLSARKLFDLTAAPLCAPELAERLKVPADLAEVTLIHISARKAGWPDWLAHVGLPDLKPRGGLPFDAIPPALEAAAQGRGVVLGLMPIVWDAPIAARLVQPFATPPISAGTYFLVHRREDAARHAVRAFADWMASEARADRRRARR